MVVNIGMDNFSPHVLAVTVFIDIGSEVFEAALLGSGWGSKHAQWSGPLCSKKMKK